MPRNSNVHQWITLYYHNWICVIVWKDVHCSAEMVWERKSMCISSSNHSFRSPWYVKCELHMVWYLFSRNCTYSNCAKPAPLERLDHRYRCALFRCDCSAEFDHISLNRTLCLHCRWSRIFSIRLPSVVKLAILTFVRNSSQSLWQLP